MLMPDTLLDMETFLLRLREVPDEILLAIWEQSQALGFAIGEEQNFPADSFERVIVHELNIRTGLRLSGSAVCEEWPEEIFLN